MKQTKKVMLIPMLFIILSFIFTILDIGLEVKQPIQLTQPIIFALTAVTAIFFLSLRKLFLIISSIFLSLMVFTYLLGLLDISNWIGSLGFGIFIVTLATYLPELIKKGFLDKY